MNLKESNLNGNPQMEFGKPCNAGRLRDDVPRVSTWLFMESE